MKDIESQENKTSIYSFSYKQICMASIVILMVVVTVVSLIMFVIGLFDNRNVSLILDIHNEKIKDEQYFKISFNSTIRLPNYTLYNLNTKSDRCNTRFKEDKELGTLGEKDIYKDLGYDKGHLVPAVDVFDSCSTFTMANVVPQIPCFNRGIWKNLEEYIRENYMGNQIITVPEYNLNKFVINKNNVKIYVPSGFYKIIYKPGNNKIIYKIYLEHTSNVCGRDFDKVGNFEKLPYFIKLDNKIH